ncbi:MAG: hypothetical protein ACHQO8_01215 [Vicinamibacterales bacterium]
MRRAPTVVLVGLTSLLSASGLAYRAPAQPATTVALLDRYERGDYQAAMIELTQVADVGAIVKDLQKFGPTWTEALGPAQLHHRRLVAASFALEAAAPHFWPQEVDPLIEWGCQLLRRNPEHDEAERAWFLASAAVYSRARDDGRLATKAGSGAALGQWTPPAARPANHMVHAQLAWPGEARLKLASAMVLAVAADTEPARDVPWVPTSMLSKDSEEGLRRARAARAIQAFAALVDVPSVGAEARVHMGYLQFTLNDVTASLESFAHAYDSNDPFVSYLARFLSGRALDRLGRRDDANAMYRMALQLIPGAQSASAALSANLFLAGHPDEAYAIAQGGLSAQPRPDDPWHEFGYGDRRFISTLVAQLHEAIK